MIKFPMSLFEFSLVKFLELFPVMEPTECLVRMQYEWAKDTMDKYGHLMDPEDKAKLQAFMDERYMDPHATTQIIRKEANK